MEIAEFLRACIAEDERRLDLPDYDVVLNSEGEMSARGDGWVTRGDCPICGAYMFDGTEAVTEEAWWDHAEATHQRSHVLAECDAKLRIVELHEPWSGGYECPTCAEGAGQDHGEIVVEHMHSPCPTLRFLALPYADRPGYREEWRP
jgi:hypothetical protein